MLKHRLNNLIKLIEIFRGKKPGTLPFEGCSIEADDAEISALSCWEPICVASATEAEASQQSSQSRNSIPFCLIEELADGLEAP